MRLHLKRVYYWLLEPIIQFSFRSLNYQLYAQAIWLMAKYQSICILYSTPGSSDEKHLDYKIRKYVQHV